MEARADIIGKMHAAPNAKAIETPSMLSPTSPHSESSSNSDSMLSEPQLLTTCAPASPKMSMMRRVPKKPSSKLIGSLISECEHELAGNPWLREPHGYLLKPDFRRVECRSDNCLDASAAPSPGLATPDLYAPRNNSGIGESTAWKLPSSLRMLANNRTRYVRCFFRLEGRMLTYFRSITDLVALGSIDLGKVDHVRLSRVKESPTHAIDLVSSERVYTLGADTREDLAGWCVAICHAMRRIAGTSHSYEESLDEPCWKQFDDVYEQGSVMLELTRLVASECHVQSVPVPLPAMIRPKPGVASLSGNTGEEGEAVATHAPISPSPAMSVSSHDLPELPASAATLPPPPPAARWFAVVGAVHGIAASHGAVRPLDLLLGVNNVSFADMSFEEAKNVLAKANYPITLRLARDVGSRLVAEGWGLVDSRLRYIELSRSALRGVRPVAGGLVADTMDFAYDLGTFSCVELSTAGNRKRITIELDGDQADTVTLEFSTSKEAQTWFSLLISQPLVRKQPVPAYTCDAVESRSDGDVASCVKQRARQKRRGSKPVSPSPTSSTTKRRFSPLSSLRKLSKNTPDLNTAARQLQKEITAHEVAGFNPVSYQDEQVSPETPFLTAFSESDEDINTVPWTPPESPSSPKKGTLPELRKLVTMTTCSVARKGENRSQLSSFFATLVERRGKETQQGRFLLVMVRHRHVLWIYAADARFSDCALDEFDLSNTEASPLPEGGHRGLRLSMYDNRVVDILLDDPHQDMHDKSRHATLLFDTCMSPRTNLAASIKNPRADVVLGNVKFRVLVNDADGDNFATAWIDCFALIQHEELKLYTNQAATNLVKAPLPLTKLLFARVLSETPHRIELTVDNAMNCRIFFRLQCNSIRDASLIVSFFLASVLNRK